MVRRSPCAKPPTRTTNRVKQPVTALSIPSSLPQNTLTTHTAVEGPLPLFSYAVAFACLLVRKPQEHSSIAPGKAILRRAGIACGGGRELSETRATVNSAGQTHPAVHCDLGF